jgi:hypothetical protein
MTRFINIFVYTLYWTQSIIALSLIYPLHKNTRTRFSFPGSWFITGTITSNHCEVFLPFRVQSPWTANSSELDQILQLCHLLKVKVEVTLRLTVGQSVSQSVSFPVERYLGLMTRYLLLFDSYCLLTIGRPLWWEDGSLFCHCMQSSSYRHSLYSSGTDHKEDTYSVVRIVVLLRCSMVHREHSSHCCLFVGTRVLSRCLAMDIHVRV